MSDHRAIFLDTSIQIAREVHSSAARRSIQETISAFAFTTTGLVVRHEFKRRLLKDVRYLHDLFVKLGSFAAVHRHVVDVLTGYQQRKQKISLQLLATIMEGESDSDLTERAMLLLKGLLRDGLYEFDQSVGHVIQESNCGCGRHEIRLKRTNYDFGPKKCTEAKECGIADFLASRRAELQAILDHLNSVDAAHLTNELNNAKQFIEEFISSPANVRGKDPCATVGDLLISLESAKIPCFYTMNGKESQHLARALKQTLVVRPSNSANPDVVCESDAHAWPKFGKAVQVPPSGVAVAGDSEPGDAPSTPLLPPSPPPEASA